VLNFFSSPVAQTRTCPGPSPLAASTAQSFLSPQPRPSLLRVLRQVFCRPLKNSADGLTFPGARQYSFAALKRRSQPDQDYPKRQENPPPYPRVVPHEPGVRLRQEQSWGQSHELREREPLPREQGSRRRLYEDKGALREKGRRVDVGARDREQRTRGEGSSSEAAMDDHRYVSGPTAERSTRHAPRSPPPRRPAKPDEIFAEHLNGLFQPLKFPPELSARVLTHASHPAAFHGHNAQFSFIGAFPLLPFMRELKSK
jgi:hypothetical protein